MFQGIFIPLVTPFTKEGEPDLPIIADLIDYFSNQKVHGYFVLGSHGMGPVMSLEERATTAEFIAGQVRGRLPIIVHVGTADTDTTVALARHADGLQIDGIAVVPPFYYSDHTEWEIFAHYRSVVDQVRNPVVVYENAKYAGYSFTPQSLARLAKELPSIAASKISGAPHSKLLDYVAELGPTFDILASSAMPLFATIPFGLKGTIPPATSYIPNVLVSLWEALVARRYEEAAQLQSVADDLQRIVVGLTQRFGRQVHREALSLLGFEVARYPRWPCEPLPASAIGVLEEGLRTAQGYTTT